LDTPYAVETADSDAARGCSHAQVVEIVTAYAAEHGESALGSNVSVHHMTAGQHGPAGRSARLPVDRRDAVRAACQARRHGARMAPLPDGTAADVEAQWVPILTGTPALDGFPNPADLGARIGGTPRNSEYVTIAPNARTWLVVDPRTYAGDLAETFEVIVRYWHITNRKLYGSRMSIKCDRQAATAEMV
jgi:hypothetical protein